jgi:hypothetical protein
MDGHHSLIDWQLVNLRGVFAEVSVRNIFNSLSGETEYQGRRWDYGMEHSKEYDSVPLMLDRSQSTWNVKITNGILEEVITVL